jgi:hypothetical protein
VVRRSDVLLVVAATLVLPGAARGQVPGSDPAALARAFTGAWNAHDAPGVVVLFWPDATVRQTGARILLADDQDGTPATPLVEDVFGAGRRRLDDAQDGHAVRTSPQGEVLWAPGTPRIRAWAAALFAAGHRMEASGYQVERDGVRWRYRAFADPYQRLAGVQPAEGTAVLVVHAGRIAALVFTSDGETVAQREREFEAALNARTAARAAVARPDPPSSSVPASSAPAPAAPAVLDPRLLLGLAGAAVLAGLVAIRRRKARPE